MSKVEYNNLSEEFKKKIGWGVPLERDQVVQFQWLNIPEMKQNGEMLPVYSMKRIPNTDSVYDSEKKEMIQIAYVTNELKNTEKDPTGGLGQIEFKKEDKCVITISGREPHRMNLLYYLRAHSLNQSNPIAPATNYGYSFKELEPVKTAKQKLKERQELASCIQYISDMKDAELISMLKALKQITYSSIDENMSALVEYVQIKSNRDKFNSLSKDVRMPIAALIANAVELEIIRYEKEPMTWIFTDTKNPFTQVPPQSDANDHIVNYFHNNEHGKSIKEFIEKQIELMNSTDNLELATEEMAKSESNKGKRKT